jgi:hypothetical protein
MLVNEYVASVASRCRERFDFYARSGDGPRDLKGVRFSRARAVLSLINLVKNNILIDESGHACLADFGLVAIISDGTSHTSSSSFTPRPGPVDEPRALVPGGFWS